MDNRPIGIFDSGVGGMTTVRELTRRAPGESIVFFGDTIRMPYGDRTAEEIKQFSRRNARFLRACGVKAVIVACNTSTANAMAELYADNADIPIVGTVSPTSAQAAEATRDGRIGVMATEATVRSGIYERTIRSLMPSAQVVSRGCPKLVPLIEGGHTQPDDAALRAALAEDLAPLKEAAVDTIVLGCTHYPIIREAILSVMGREVALVDSGAACVGTILGQLAARDALAVTNGIRREKFYCSARREEFTAVAEGFLGRSISALTEEISVEEY